MENAGPKPTDLAWLAGVFDGEGCVRISSTNSITAAITNTSLPLIQHIVDLVGGKYRTMKKRKEHHLACMEWFVYGDNAARFYRMIRPYLVEKGSQVDLALEFREYPPRSAGRAAILKALADMKVVDYE